MHRNNKSHSDWLTTLRSPHVAPRLPGESSPASSPRRRSRELATEFDRREAEKKEAFARIKALEGDVRSVAHGVDRLYAAAAVYAQEQAEQERINAIESDMRKLSHEVQRVRSNTDAVRATLQQQTAQAYEAELARHSAAVAAQAVQLQHEAQAQNARVQEESQAIADAAISQLACEAELAKRQRNAADANAAETARKAHEAEVAHAQEQAHAEQQARQAEEAAEEAARAQEVARAKEAARSLELARLAEVQSTHPLLAPLPFHPTYAISQPTRFYPLRAIS